VRYGSNGVATPDDLDQGNIRKRRIPEMAIGLVLIIGGAIGSLLLYQSASNTVTVVALSRDVARGHVLMARDLVAMQVPADAAGIFIAGTNAQQLVGKTLVVDGEKDSPIVAAMLSTRSPLGPSEALVATSVDIGSYPPLLSEGDSVQLVFTPDITTGNVTPPTMYSNVVTVWSVSSPDDSLGKAVVTFRGPKDLALAVAGAGSVHIALVQNTDTTTGP
jgi:hypothetical protein